MAIVKDPDAVSDYQFDWSEWLPEGDTISLSTMTSSHEDMVVDDDENTSTTATVWLSGGVAGTTYYVTNHITTAQGREDDRTIAVKVLQK